MPLSRHVVFLNDLVLVRGLVSEEWLGGAAHLKRAPLDICRVSYLYLVDVVLKHCDLVAGGVLLVIGMLGRIVERHKGRTWSNLSGGQQCSLNSWLLLFMGRILLLVESSIDGRTVG